jgi:membrane fusion protein (multidrug efflux system)
MRYAIAILGLVLLVASLAGVKAMQISTLMGFGEKMQAAGAPPESVTTAVATQQTWEETIDAVASVVSVKGVALSNDAAGVVSRLYFESGATVKQGQPLVELDTKVERAQLTSLRARLKLAGRSQDRSRALAESGAVSRSQVDIDESAFESQTADVKALEAQIERKIVRAPFSGRLGIRAVNLGQYLAPGTPLTMLEATDAVYIDFTLPQQYLGTVATGMRLRAFAEKEKPALAEGTISAIDPTIDALTRSLKVRASLPGKGDVLRPGMFVNVQIIMPTERTRVVIPLTAVIHAPYGDSVFATEVKPGAPAGRKTARQKFVRLGPTRGDFVAVSDGLAAGEEVVATGAFKLRNGSPLAISKDERLKPELAPRPENH